MDGLSYDVLAPGIISIPNLYEDASELVSACKEVDVWKQATAGPEHIVSEYRICHDVPIAGAFDSRFQKFEGALQLIAGDALQTYTNYNNFVTARTDEGYQVCRYQVGGRYNEHTDWTFPNFVHRELSLIIALSDPGAYSGGELVFPMQDLSLRPEKGTAILFLSGVGNVHAVRDVTEGERFTMCTWFNHNVDIHIKSRA